MFADERKAEIQKYVSRHKRVTVSHLADIFSSSESTIRRDLQDLEELGQLKRTHGGAISLDTAGFEPTFQEKNVQHADAKARIGQLCASFVEDGQTILLDAGTTTVQIARLITARDVTIVTNSQVIANELSRKPDIHLMMLGGELRRTTEAFVGPFTELLLGNLHVDMAFLGANGVHLRGVTTPNAVEAATKRAMAKCASQVIIAADVSKFGQISFVQVCGWNDVDVIVTDEEISDMELRESLHAHQVEVCIADKRM